MAVAGDGPAVRRHPGAGHDARDGLAPPARHLDPDRRARPPDPPHARSACARRGPSRSRSAARRPSSRRWRSWRCAAASAVIVAAVDGLPDRGGRGDRGARRALRPGADAGSRRGATGRATPRGAGGRRWPSLALLRAARRRRSPRARSSAATTTPALGAGRARLVVVARRALIARPAAADAAPARAPAGGLAGLGLWSLVSAGWADSVEQATSRPTAGSSTRRSLGMLLVLVRSDRAAVAAARRARRRRSRWSSPVVRSCGCSARDPGRPVPRRRASTSRWATSTARARFFLLGCWLLPGGGRAARSALAGGAALGGRGAAARRSRCCRSRAAWRSRLVALGRRRARRRAGARAARLGARASSRRRWRSPSPAAARRLRRPRGRATLDAAAVGRRGRGRLLLAAGVGAALWRAARSWRVARRPSRAGACAPARDRRGGARRGRARGRGGGRARAGSPTGQSRSTTRSSSPAPRRRRGDRVAAAVGRGQPLRLLARRLAGVARRTRCAGVGAGNYDAPYFRAAHHGGGRPPAALARAAGCSASSGSSALLLAAARVGAVALRRLARAARRARSRRPRGCSRSRRSAIVVAWLVHTSVDWMHLLPGVTGDRARRRRRARVARGPRAGGPPIRRPGALALAAGGGRRARPCAASA